MPFKKSSRLVARTLICIFAMCPSVCSSVVLGDLVIADENANNGSGAIIVVDPNTGHQSILASGGFLSDPTAVIASREGPILVADRSAAGGNGAIISVDVSNGAQTQVTSSGFLVEPVALAFLGSGDLLVLDQGTSAAAGKIVKVSSTTGTQSLLASGGFLDWPSSIVVASNGAVYVAVASLGVIKIDPETGTQNILASGGGFHPFALALTASGELLAADFHLATDWNLVAVDLSNGAIQFRSVLASPAITNVVGLASLLDGSAALVDPDAFRGPGAASGAVFLIETMGGNPSPISSGGDFRRPTGVCIYGVRNGATPAHSVSWGRLKSDYRK